eukprot:5747808-Amphidinium_carterae.1
MPQRWSSSVRFSGCASEGGRLARPPPSWQSDNLEGAGSGKLGQLEAAQMLEQRMLQVPRAAE